MNPVTGCDVCGGLTDPYRLIVSRDLIIGLSRQCIGCNVLAKTLQLFPEYMPLAAFLFWTIDRSLFLRLLDIGKRTIVVLEMFADQANPCYFQLIGPARTVSTDSWNTTTITLAKSWLNNCSKNHTVCRNSQHTTLPTRVVDVGKTDEEIRLYITESESTPYVALSHCWGSNKPIETKSSNLQQHIKGLAFDANSKTFADAVRVTRDLGFRYLWIDSLCIVQDDKEDWAIEAGRMSQVYRNAAFTISAEAATTAREGLFASSNKRAELQRQRSFDFVGMFNASAPLHVRVRDKSYFDSRKLSHASKAMPTTELSNRAWVVQERLLSPRMLHFYEEELAWSCCSISACECRLDAGVAETSVFKGLSHDPATKSQTEYEMQRQWSGLVAKFSTKKLTYATDRLPALSGLAGLVRDVMNYEYFAGLWEFDIPYGLLWFSDHQKAGEHLITRFKYSDSVPSWTWASVVGPVTYLERHRTQFEHRTRSAEVKPLLTYVRAETTPVGPNKFGDVQAGSVTVRGQLLRVKYFRDRKVWRPSNAISPLNDTGTDTGDELAKSFSTMVVSPNEPTHEPQITYDVLEEDPTILDEHGIEHNEFFFLRAGIYISGGLFSSHAQENVCLLLRRYNMETESESRVKYRRVGILLRGFHSHKVWSYESEVELTLV